MLILGEYPKQRDLQIQNMSDMSRGRKKEDPVAEVRVGEHRRWEMPESMLDLDVLEKDIGFHSVLEGKPIWGFIH